MSIIPTTHISDEGKGLGLTSNPEELKIYTQKIKDSLVLYKQNPNLVFPTRILDSYTVCGNPSMDIMIRKIVS